MTVLNKKNYSTKYRKDNSGILKELFFGILKIRKVEEKIMQLYSQQEMRCPVHLCIGQEAIPVGVCSNLKVNDVVFGSHRSHGYYIARGGDIGALMAELYGKTSGCTKGKGGSQHLSAPEVGFIGASAIVAGTIPIAVGAALAFKLKNQKNIAVVDFGDGAVDEGVFYESLNFTALKKLPVLFICENNFYATHAHQLTRQAKDNIFKKAEAFGVPAVRTDGNDVIRVFNTAKKAVQLIRSGKGPVFIEYRTYRWLEHVGPNYDYNLGYRSKKELDKWVDRCPIKQFKKYLLAKKLLTIKEIQKRNTEIDRKIEKAVSFAKKSPFPSSKELLADTYYL
jgi:pyruvate dehydrogenase E1 component alpha subunit